MQVDMDGRGPRHAQLARALRTAILGGRLRAGARLPATRNMASQLNLSRNTVLSAYEQLRVEGYLRARVGSGTYVADVAAAKPRRQSPLATEPPTRYAARARSVDFRPFKRGGEGIRWDMQVGEPMTDPALFTAWRRALARAALYADPRYPDATGLPALREALCDYLGRRRGVDAEPADVVVVSGTQQAIGLTARVLLEEGDAAGVEEPPYFGIRAALWAHGARLIPLVTDTAGLITDRLPKRAPRIICVTPANQFPSGVVMSLPRRQALLRYASANRCWIVEDDYDSEFRYDSEPLPALRSIDRDDRVIYVGTFSKTLFPALRLGYLVVPRALRRDFGAAKRIHDFGTPVIEQAAMAQFIADGSFERHIRKASATLRARRELMLEGLRAHAGEHVEVSGSHAGMHLAVWLRGFDQDRCQALVDVARAKGLALYPIAPHYLAAPRRAGLLLGYAGLSVRELEAAMQVLGECIRETAPRVTRPTQSPGPESGGSRGRGASAPRRL
jgi:GntR family transcriptional regulator/MocR family aminotransferase